jgi:acetoin utilization protein AcuB
MEVYMTEARAVMTKKVLTIKAMTPIQVAYEDMKEHSIRHMPVVDTAGKLVGILSDRDVLKAANIRMINEIEQEMTFNPHHTVEDFLSWPVQTVSEKAHVEDLAKMMIEQKVSAFVINGPNHYIKGIVTTDDLLQYLIELLRTSDSIKKVPVEHLLWRNP